MAQQRVLGLAGLLFLALLPGVQPHNFLKDSAAKIGLGFEIIPPKEVVTVTKARLTLPCQPIATPRQVINVTWTTNRQNVNDPRRHVLPNGTLLITEVRSSDVGQYRCVLKRGSRSVVSASVNLLLADVGTWVMHPRNHSVLEGTAVRLTCHLHSKPVAILTWIKDQVPITANTRYYFPSPGVLQITNITTQDSGIYKCIAVNSVLKENFTSSGGRLSIVLPGSVHRNSSNQPDVLPPRPKLLAVPSKVEAKIGKKAVLECITDDTSQPQLLWSRIDSQNIRDQGVRRAGQGSLEFQHVMEADTGVYNCSVVNIYYQNPITQMIELSVLKTPEVSVYPLSGNVQNGASAVRINCTSHAYPAPEIEWKKDGLQIPKSGRHHVITILKEKNIIVEQLAVTNIMGSDSGIFQCIARNRLGVASEASLLTVDRPFDMPGAPDNLRVLDSTSGSITVQWSPPQDIPNNATLAYTVHYFQMGGPGQEQQKMTIETHYRINELQPYTNYSIYVRVFTIVEGHKDANFGEPSATIVWRTDPLYPTKLPEVTLTPLTPTSLQISWVPLTKEEARSEITLQKVQWRKKGSHYYDETEVSATTTLLSIQDLLPSKKYEVRVLVATEAGYPPHDMQLPWEPVRMPRADNHITGKSRKGPSMHLTVLSDNPSEIIVNWALTDELLSNVFSYEVICTTYNNTPNKSVQKNLHAASNSVVLDQLENGQCYIVRVEPMYNGGRDSMKETICTMTESPIAFPPEDKRVRFGVKSVKVITLNTTSLQVMWRTTGRKIKPLFYTVRVANLGLKKQARGGSVRHLRGKSEMGKENSNHKDKKESGTHKTFKKNQNSRHDDTDLTEEITSESYIRVTRQPVVVSNLKPLHTYEVTVSASTVNASSLPSHPVYGTTVEGVPTAPVNVSWNAVSPKDALLTWSPPERINGNLLFYLVTYSRDLREWKNSTVDKEQTTAQVKDLVSNTNYTIRISGVTGAGQGSYTTVFVYIRARLENEAQVSTELVVMSVVVVLATVTCVVVALLCYRMVRLRQDSSPFQGNGTCQVIYANGVKTSRMDHGSELNDYKPMLTSLPPATHNHHLDTKGGPESHDDGVVANCSLETNSDSIKQVVMPSEKQQSHAFGNKSSNVEDSLEDIDDDTDASSKLLNKLSETDPLFSSIKNLDTRHTNRDTNQADQSLSSDSVEIAKAPLS